MNTTAKTFVDDNILHTRSKQGQSIQHEVLESIARLQEYMNSNLLSLNPDKSRIMVLSKNNKIQEDFSVEVQGKTLVNQPALTILGNIVTSDLTWEKTHKIDCYSIPLK